MTKPGEGSFHGIKGDELDVSLEGGGSHTLRGSSPEALPSTSNALVGTRKVLLNSLPAQGGNIRQAMIGVTAELNRQVSGLERHRTKAGKLPGQQIKRLESFAKD